MQLLLGGLQAPLESATAQRNARSHLSRTTRHPQGRLIMTHPTKAIFYTLLQDFVRVSAGSADEALYTEADLEAAMARAEVLDFDQTIDIDGIQVCVCGGGLLFGLCVHTEADLGRHPRHAHAVHPHTRLHTFLPLEITAYRAGHVWALPCSWSTPGGASVLHTTHACTHSSPDHCVPRWPRAGCRHVHGRHRRRAHAVHWRLQPRGRQAPARRRHAGAAARHP